MDLEFVHATLQEFFSRRPEVSAAYLFGSHATRTATLRSDVDVAVLLRPEVTLPAKTPYGYVAELSADLAEILRTDRIDVVVLNQAGVLLKYQVLRHGHLICINDPLADHMFRFRTIQTYLDTAPIRREQERQLEKRIAEGRFGIQE